MRTMSSYESDSPICTLFLVSQGRAYFYKLKRLKPSQLQHQPTKFLQSPLIATRSVNCPLSLVLSLSHRQVEAWEGTIDRGSHHRLSCQFSTYSNPTGTEEGISVTMLMKKERGHAKCGLAMRIEVAGA